MRRVAGRTTAVALITAAALGIPCVAWFVAGSRTARQEAEDVRREPLTGAREVAERAAQQVALRLESLRRSESRRSFLDYRESDAALPDVACEPLLRSPLALGPPDPLVWTHFQIDAVGRFTLPTLGQEESRRDDRDTESIQTAILEQLECAPPIRPDDAVSPTDSDVGNHQSWVASVGPLRWYSLTLPDGPALTALRTVETPNAELSQGFVIRSRELATLLSDAPLPAELHPGPPAGDLAVRLPIDGAEWSVAVDAGDAVAAAAVRAHDVLRGFYQIFAAGLVAALLAGVLVVGLVRQSERLAQQRARFAASAAHELRTPLAGLRMYGEMLADDSGDPQKARRYARRIAGEAERLGRVVSNLMGFSRLERGELAVHCKPGDLASAVGEVVDGLRPNLEAAGLQLTCEIPALDLPTVRFDRDALVQILQNLLDNAEKHTRGTARRDVRVHLALGPRGVALSVEDQGPGVAPRLRGRLFEPFVRHGSPDGPDGLGLGLTLVRALSRAQDAEVDYADAAGGGSRFTVTFPSAA